jgi:hypothetical protein
MQENHITNLKFMQKVILVKILFYLFLVTRLRKKRESHWKIMKER